MNSTINHCCRGGVVTGNSAWSHGCNHVFAVGISNSDQAAYASDFKVNIATSGQRGTSERWGSDPETYYG